MGKVTIALMLCAAGLFMASNSAIAATDTINLNSPQWLGTLGLSKTELDRIKKAAEQALDSPIDAAQQCGEVRLDCVVRAAREWTVGDDRYREIVIVIHNVGHTSHAIGQIDGKWPTFTIK